MIDVALKSYISLGGGVDSTALLLWLRDQGINPEPIFVDHGGDYPHTYQYIEYLQGKGFEITILKPEISILDYCERDHVFPMRRWRWCTDRFKLTPMRKYMKTPAICYIGISAYEKRRIARFSACKSGVFNAFPLSCVNLSREDLIAFISTHGLAVPKKSGCFICPMASKKEISAMKREHPDLYKIRVHLELNQKRKTPPENLPFFLEEADRN